jgi:hypothetical protein
MADALPDNAVVIVVGAHLLAEKYDRPISASLQQHIACWRDAEGAPSPLKPITCCDLWWFNHSRLRNAPTISIGGPPVNAVTAYLSQRLPTVVRIEDQLTVQVDLDQQDLRAAIWGADEAQTLAAVKLFRSKYLDDYLKAVRRWYGQQS